MKDDPLLEEISDLRRVTYNVQPGPGYKFTIFAVSKYGMNTEGPFTSVHVSDDGSVTIEVVERDEDFPEHLLECVMHRAEILR